MSCRAGFVWDTAQHFIRYIEDCGVTCELVTPYMLAASFFKGSFNCLIIPTGFANPAYCHLLPALRASSGRITSFVENGGHLLVFGAAIDHAGAYDWLPFPVTYLHEIHPRKITCPGSLKSGALIQDFDSESIECDGSFPVHSGDAAGTSEGTTVIIEKKIGNGTIVVTSVHEYPSRAFLKEFCTSGIQTLF
ncbi:MAG: hypothetical protein LUQ31_04440 [Methanoregula sp.]|nr:hypothetical protein [Methanoregula sp.]